jgi:hypothetical protein
MAARRAGEIMSFDEAVTYALGSTVSSPAQHAPDELTFREREVVIAIAGDQSSDSRCTADLGTDR